MPSPELHTSLLQIRGKCFLSPGFHPPRSHIRPLKTSAPAPSRGANSALALICTHSYSGVPALTAPAINSATTAPGASNLFMVLSDRAQVAGETASLLNPQ